MKLKYILVFTAIIALTSFCSAQGTSTTDSDSSSSPSSSSPTTGSSTSGSTSASGSASGSTSASTKSSTSGSTSSSATGYTPVPTAEPSDIANLPKFTYNLVNETKTTRDNIRLQNMNYCLTTCGGASNALKNFLNVTTMGWGCGCGSKTPDFKFYEWPINTEDCRNRGLACTAACQTDTIPFEKKSGCNTACNIVYNMQCGTANQVYYRYDVENESDIPSYSSENDPGNPSASSSSATSSPTETGVGTDSPSGASIQNPIIWAISALAIVAAGMMTL